MPRSSRPHWLPPAADVPPQLLAAVRDDYRRYAAEGLPAPLERLLLDRYGLDVTAAYAGRPLRNPWGKASGQLSMTVRQVEEDVQAGLGFVVLKTVIARDASGAQSMHAWAVKESRMAVEPIVGASGERGWTVSWKGRGWWQPFDDYLALVREAAAAGSGGGTLVVPSCKYHLPDPDEPDWNVAEYEHTTRRLLEAWQAAGAAAPMPLEKDFSPTLAGSDHARQQEKVLEWLRTVPELVRGAVPDTDALSSRGARDSGVRIGLKLFNSLFGDEFQLRMLRTIHEPGPGRPDFYVYGNRLFDPDRAFDGHRGIAFGGPDLSDRNLRILGAFHAERARLAAADRLDWSATGNIASGRTALEYALRGASSFQLHTFFQLPAEQYAMRSGCKTQKALHELYFHPSEGLIVWMHHLAAVLRLPRDPIRFLDVVGKGRPGAPRA